MFWIANTRTNSGGFWQEEEQEKEKTNHVPLQHQNSRSKDGKLGFQPLARIPDKGQLTSSFPFRMTNVPNGEQVELWLGPQNTRAESKKKKNLTD